MSSVWPAGAEQCVQVTQQLCFTFEQSPVRNVRSPTPQASAAVSGHMVCARSIPSDPTARCCVCAVAGAGDSSADDSKHQAGDAVPQGPVRPGPEQRGGQHGWCNIADSSLQAAARRELQQLKETSKTREAALAAELEHAVIVAQDYCGNGRCMRRRSS